MSENPYRSPDDSQRRPWYLRPSIAFALAVALYGAAMLLTQVVLLAHGAGDLAEYETRVAPSTHGLVKAINVILLAGSTLCLLAVPVLYLRNRRSRGELGQWRP